jgi:hypothetical protein
MLLPILAQQQRVQYRPYIDQRRYHYGFMIGINAQDYEFVNNAYVTSTGESWFADIGQYSPGFSVGILGEMYLAPHLSLRAVPTLHFGSKRVVFMEQNSEKKELQTMKSTVLTLPIDLKFSADRCNNYRPYIMAGIGPAFDLTKKKQLPLLTKNFDIYAEIGLGCDFYLPFFKLIPELKFCFGLLDLLQKDRKDLTDKSLLKYTQSLNKVSSKMIVLSFYFE